MCLVDEKLEKKYPLHDINEGDVWLREIRPLLLNLPENVLDIWHHGFTEMLNNAIDHSVGSTADISLKKTSTLTEIKIQDDGKGIFKKVQAELNLLDARHSVLELAKGKLTTDPKNHSGEGVFFSARMFDAFSIVSGHVCFSHLQKEKGVNWVIEEEPFVSGTVVIMVLANNSQRTCQEIFDKFTSGEDYGFTKTIVPVRLAEYGDDKLISRSQAKRVLVRIEKFKSVVFDFEGVETIGQAFADEIFRVFQNGHTEIAMISVNTNEQVKRFILRAVANNTRNLS